MIGTEVGRVEAFDPDFGSDLTYSTSQNPFFNVGAALNNRYVAVLMVKSELDYETLSEHQCTITVSDGFLYASGISTISVVDVNDIQVESITILDSLDHSVVSEGLSTIGNNIVRIRGSNLAYLNKSNKIDITVTNAHVASPSTTFEESLLNCKINENYGRGNEEVSCDSPPGHGNMLSMEIKVTAPGYSGRYLGP